MREKRVFGTALWFLSCLALAAQVSTNLMVDTKRAEAGDPAAQFRLGCSYEMGVGVSQSYSNAVVWYQKSAGSKYAPAQRALGSLYIVGMLGVPKDPAQGVQLLTQAANGGEPIAQGVLAGMYSLGENGCPKDPETAAKWAKRGANQGDRSSQFILGFLYLAGRGVEKDPVEGFKWILLADFGGVNATTKQMVARVQATLTPEQIEKARELVAAFKPQPENRAN